MAKEAKNQGGPTRRPKDEPTENRDHQNAQSRAELSARSVKGARPGRGVRNGSAKKR